MQLLLSLVVVFLFCDFFSSCAAEQSDNWIVRLLYPLEGSRLCSNHVAQALGFIRVNPARHDATISASIDDIVVWTSAGARQDVLAGVPFLEFPLLQANVLAGKMLQTVQSSHSLRIAVFDDSGEDLQPEILSEFLIVPCLPPSNIALSRKSLIVTRVCRPFKYVSHAYPQHVTQFACRRRQFSQCWKAQCCSSFRRVLFWR
jgi:hypothetical protein